MRAFIKRNMFLLARNLQAFNSSKLTSKTENQNHLKYFLIFNLIF